MYEGIIAEVVMRICWRRMSFMRCSLMTVLTGDGMADLALFLSLASLLELECPIKGTVVLMALRPSGR